MDFIIKLLKLLEPGSARLYNSILVIINQLTKASYFVSIEETIIAEEIAYKITKLLVVYYGLPKQFIIDCGTLFTSKY